MIRAGLWMIAIGTTGLAGPVMARQGVQVELAGDHPPQQAPADHFTGKALVTGRFQREAPACIGGATVTFEPGAHTNWHSHPLGQTLIVTQGHGFVQEWRHRAQPIGPGDTVWIAPGVKHWHGAGPEEAMTHVAITESLDGQTVTWMETVRVADYALAMPHQR
jgi:quercetin dioxygenase-like cupin family protein